MAWAHSNILTSIEATARVYLRFLVVVPETHKKSPHFLCQLQSIQSNNTASHELQQQIKENAFYQTSQAAQNVLAVCIVFPILFPAVVFLRRLSDSIKISDDFDGPFGRNAFGRMSHSWTAA